MKAKKKLCIIVLLLNIVYSARDPVQVMSVKAEEETSQVAQKMKLTFAGKEQSTFRGNGAYTIDFQDLNVLDTQRTATYTLFLPEGVTPASGSRAQSSYDEKSRTLTLRQPKTKKELLAIELMFDVKSEVTLTVEKTENGHKTTSNACVLTVSEDTGNSVVPNAPKLNMTPEAAPREKPVLRGGINVVQNQVAMVYDWMDLIDALSNFRVKQIILQKHIVFPKADGKSPEVLYRESRGNNGAKDVTGGWTYTDPIRWRTSSGNTWTEKQGSAVFLGLARNDNTYPGGDKVVINGQGQYAIDLAGITLTWHDGQPHDITFKDITTYGANYYGMLTFNDISRALQAKSKLTYENVIANGTQMLHSPDTPIEFKGYVSNIHDDVGRYYSPFRKEWVTYNYRDNGYMEANLYAGNLDIAENAQIYMYSSSSGNIDLNGIMNVHKGAVVYLNSSFEMQRNSGRTSPNTAGSGDDTEGANIKLGNTGDSQDIALNLMEQSRVFVAKKEFTPTTAELWENKAGYVWLKSKNSSLTIKEGASLEIYAPNHTGKDKRPGSNSDKGPIFYMDDNAKIDIQDYGNFSIYAPGMGSGATSPIYLYNQSTLGSKNVSTDLSVGNNGIFEVVADTDSPLIYVDGNTRANVNISFDQAQRVNLQRYKSPTTLRATEKALIGGVGEAAIKIKHQNISQWDDGNAYTFPLSQKKTEEQTLLNTGVHDEMIPAGQKLITDFRWDKTALDSQRTHEWQSVKEATMNFAKDNSNATITGVVTTYGSHIGELEKKLGRSSSVQTQTTSSTTGNKPNQILLTKMYDMEVQLFSTITDNVTKTSREYSGSVTNGYKRNYNGTFMFDSDGNYVLDKDADNAEKKTFTYDPRNEIIGRVGIYNEGYRFDESQRKMVKFTEFIPIEEANVKLAANGSLIPVADLWAENVWHSSEKPEATATINASEFAGVVLSQTKEFKDGKYTVSSTKANETITTSTGAKIDGAGYFIYKIPNNANLVAQDLIKVSVFKAGIEFIHGKEAKRQSLLVKDETNPTAVSKKEVEVQHNQSGKLPSPSIFIESVDDTNPYKWVDGYYTYHFDYSAVSNDPKLVAIQSASDFSDIIRDLNTDPKQKYLINVVVKDAAGNPVMVTSVVFRVVDLTTTEKVKDVYITETQLNNSAFAQDEQLLKNLLVQQAVEKVNYQAKDDVSGQVILNKDYFPSKTADANDHLFRISSLNGLYSEQKVGKVYKIDITLLADKANPGKDGNKGIVQDYNFEFHVLLLSDVQTFTSAANPIDFGEKQVSGVTSVLGQYDMVQKMGFSLIDTKGHYDTSKGKEVQASVQTASSAEKIEIGLIDNIQDIQKMSNHDVLDTWRVRVAMTQPFTNEKGKTLKASIHFSKGNITQSAASQDFDVHHTISYNFGSVTLVDGKVGDNDQFQKGENTIEFKKEDVKLNIMEELQQAGEYTAELTYSLEDVPNR